MKSLFKGSILAMGLSISAFANDMVPRDSVGGVTDPMYAGASSCEISSSTGTTSLMCATGPGIILGIYGSSVAATDQLVFRDSATINTTSTKLLTVDLTTLSKPAQMFPRFKNALQVKALVAPGGDGPASHPAWTIIYRSLSGNN